MSESAFREFRDLVLDDRELQSELAAVSDTEAFTKKVVELAAEHGIAVDASDVAEAMNAGRRALIEQWI